MKNMATSIVHTEQYCWKYESAVYHMNCGVSQSLQAQQHFHSSALHMLHTSSPGHTYFTSTTSLQLVSPASVTSVRRLKSWDWSSGPTSLETCHGAPALTQSHLADNQSQATILITLFICAYITSCNADYHYMTWNEPTNTSDSHTSKSRCIIC